VANDDAIRAELLAVLKEHLPEGVDVRASSTLSGDLALDSLAMMEILGIVEDRLGVIVPEESLPEVCTVADVERVLFALVAKKGGPRS
jgi:acyl carrier protein